MAVRLAAKGLRGINSVDSLLGLKDLINIYIYNNIIKLNDLIQNKIKTEGRMFVCVLESASVLGDAKINISGDMGLSDGDSPLLPPKQFIEWSRK